MDSFEWGLRSEEAKVIARSMAKMLISNVFDTERAHSKRAQRSRHQLTHKMSLSSLAALHQAVAGPPWFEHNVKAQGPAERGDNQRTSSDDSVGAFGFFRAQVWGFASWRRDSQFSWVL